MYMHKSGMIDCPICKKRIFEDSDTCPYCKLNLKNKENNFDKTIYDFLYQEYNNTKNKSQTIKTGTQKFNKSMKEIKEIVDYIADEIYNKELAEKNKIPKEDLPTNGIDYSKIKYTKRLFSKSTKRKIPILDIIGLILYFVLILWLHSVVDAKIYPFILYIAIFIGIGIFAYIIFKYSELPPDPHTFSFSFKQYFIHNLIYKIIIYVFLIWALIHFADKITKLDNGIIFIILWMIFMIILFYVFLYQLMKKSSEKFIVEHNLIRYEYERKELFRVIYNDDSVHRYEYFTIVSYDFSSIKHVYESINSIIIYANIKKQVSINYPGKEVNKPVKNLNKIRITKSFSNNKNLIKALKILEIKEKE